MSDSARVPKVSEARIGKQIMLPWSKAIEIAAKSIRVRFWRSMITMSSVVLAIAFLMYIWTSTAILAALAVAPQRAIDAVKERLAVVREALRGEAGAPSAGDVETRFARDLAAAVSRQRRTIADKTSAIVSAGSEEAKKLQKEIDELEAELAPANTVPFLESYLLTRRRELERQQGELKRLLQQDRGGQEQAAGPGGAEAPQTPVRGVGTDFLAQMSPADKWLAILALLVCFVGIANAMFMTVQERFREIGTMKCLGALDLFIVKIFLLESAALGLIGTLLGIGAGLLLAFLNHLRLYGGPAYTYFPMGNILVAAIFATLIGLILSVLAAIFPARKAARMEPVEAMRAEE